MGITEGESDVGKLLSEHHELLEHICSVRDWVGGVTELGMPRFGELGSRLIPLREELALHFAEEESGRYSEEAPFDTREKMVELREQHQEILHQLDLLIGSLRAKEPEFRSWQAAVERVESLIADICHHERQETTVIQSAVGRGPRTSAE
ncbi:MAG: hypothetical protein KDB01_26560 [Planctomycetaceae bacterium]|nr:hypothetical protein [Planctomycetaceae bacterium]